MAVELKRRLLTVDEYHLMGEVGILNERGIELINGEIIEMSPIESRHAAVVEKIKDLLVYQLHKKVIVRVQNPIFIDSHSEPEPDIAVVAYKDDYYQKGHPTPKNIHLIIEVADSSIEYDKEIKLPIYASTEIPEVWIVDLNTQRLEVYHSPEDGHYQQKEILKTAQHIQPKMIPLDITVSELFI